MEFRRGAADDIAVAAVGPERCRVAATRGESSLTEMEMSGDSMPDVEDKVVVAVGVIGVAGCKG